MTSLRKAGVLSVLFVALATASYADVHGGFEFSGGFTSQKLFGSDTGNYLMYALQVPAGLRLSGFVGFDTSSDESNVAIGFDQHFGVHVFTLASVDHVPLVFSLPTRFFVRFGSNKLALDIIGGIDNQIVVGGASNYPAYYSTIDGKNYRAAPSGYAMGLEIGLRFVIRHFYITGTVDLPVTDSYLFPGEVRLGLGCIF